MIKQAEPKKREPPWQALEQIGIHKHAHTAVPLRSYLNGRRRSLKRKPFVFGAVWVAAMNSRQQTKLSFKGQPFLNSSKSFYQIW